MPRFVLLEHDHPTRHWDLMLDAGQTLRTWRLAAPPTPMQIVLAEAIGAHRRIYLDYEGPVSGGRGTVARWDGGEFTWIEDAADRIVVQLTGTRLRGILQLEQTAEGEWHAYLKAEPPG